MPATNRVRVWLQHAEAQLLREYQKYPHLWNGQHFCVFLSFFVNHDFTEEPKIYDAVQWKDRSVRAPGADQH